MELISKKIEIMKLNIKHLKQTIQEAKYNIVCGHHSGFKPCCIVWYTFIWSPVRVKGYGNKQLNWICQKYFNAIPYRFTYIPCPRCLYARKSIQMKYCTCNGYKNGHIITT